MVIKLNFMIKKIFDRVDYQVKELNFRVAFIILKTLFYVIYYGFKLHIYINM